MDDRLKKRLIGATVLVSLVVIFVPMLLQHEPVLDQGIQGSNIPPRPQREYDPTLLPKDDENLSRPLMGTVRIDPGERLPFMEPLVPVEESLPSKPAPARPASPAARPPKPRAAPQPAPGKAAAKKPAASKAAATPPRPTGKGWVVQLGSFSRRGNAEKLVRRLRARNFEASMERATVKGKTLYRVLVGPEADRARAERLLTTLDRELRPLKLKGKLRRY